MTLKEQALGYLWNNVIGKMDAKRIEKQLPAWGIEAKTDIPYLDDGNKMHLLDVYRPEKAEGLLPVIIDIHGGGWMYGNKELNKNYCYELAARGFTVFNVSYRLAPEVRFDAQMRDVFAAYRFIGEHVKEYGGDPDNIFLTGDSAGGHIVTLTSVINGNEAFEKDFGVCQTGITFNAIGAVSPVVDLTRGIMRQMLTILLGNQYESSPLYRYMDFENVYTGQPIPPFYVVTSGGDNMRQQARELHRVLRSHQAEHRFHDWTGESEESLPHVFSVSFPTQRESAVTIDEMTSYFRQFLRAPVQA